MGFFLQGAPTPTKKARAPRAAPGERAARAAPAGPAKAMPLSMRARHFFPNGCAQCTLDREAARLRHPKMNATGAEDPLLYILGEAPGENEDLQGKQFIGKSGELIRDQLPLSLGKRTRWSNTVQCRPPDNRTPTAQEVACCWHRVVADIEATKPLIVLGFGGVPLKWALDVEHDKNSITDWRGQLIPIRVGSWCCWYAPVWHPSFMLRKKNDKKFGEAFNTTWKRDLRRVFDLLSGELELEEPWIPEGEELSAGMHWELSWDVAEVERFLDHLGETLGEDILLDIETTAIRPYVKDARILSIAFGTWDLSYAIPIAHSEAKWAPAQLKQIWELVGRFMRRKDKVFWAHPAKFEQEWLSMPFALGRNILFEPRWGDTMAQAAVLSSSSLTFLSLDNRCKALFGVGEKRLDDLDRANLDAVPLPDVLRYNTRDVKFEDLVRQMQTPLIEREGLQEAYRMMVSRVPALVIAQQEGVLPDHAFADAQHAELKKKISAIEKRIEALPVVRAMVAEEGKPFNPGSPVQLAKLLRDRLKEPAGWVNVGGAKKYSTDESVLSQISHPIGKLILDMRGLAKLDGTYVVGLCSPSPEDPARGKTVWPDGRVHTNYNYLITATGRLSSDDPNLQNFPAREHKEIRNAIRARLRHLFAACDYGQIEARIIAMASGCPVLTKALWEHYDIHMDWAQQIAKAFPFVLQKYEEQAEREGAKQIKLFRSDIKNVWTFPAFYGSPLAPIAATLGIQERKLAPYFEAFWEAFAAVKRMQDRMVANYKKRGYVETLTGRRRYEPLTLNQIINAPIQGTASDIVVDAQERCAQEAYERKNWNLAARMNVHDDLTFDLPEDGVEEHLEIILPIMCQPRFDFVTVPITVEVKLGNRWGSLEELATVESTEYGYPNR